MNKIKTLTTIISGTLLAGVLVLTGHSIGEYRAANHFRPKIEFKEKQNLELDDKQKETVSELVEKAKSGYLKELKRIEFEEKWEDSLFNYARLGKVDFSRKKVTLDVYIDESEKLEIYKKIKRKCSNMFQISIKRWV